VVSGIIFSRSSQGKIYATITTLSSLHSTTHCYTFLLQFRHTLGHRSCYISYTFLHFQRLFATFLSRLCPYVYSCRCAYKRNSRGQSTQIHHSNQTYHISEANQSDYAQLRANHYTFSLDFDLTFAYVATPTAEIPAVDTLQYITGPIFVIFAEPNKTIYTIRKQKNHLTTQLYIHMCSGLGPPEMIR
jgi:hypothetical protein